MKSLHDFVQKRLRRFLRSRSRKKRAAAHGEKSRRSSGTVGAARWSSDQAANGRKPSARRLRRRAVARNSPRHEALSAGPVSRNRPGTLAENAVRLRP